MNTKGFKSNKRKKSLLSNFGSKKNSRKQSSKNYQIKKKRLSLTKVF